MVEERAYRNYLEILKRELVPALGCTEPICLAFAAAKSREILGQMPERVLAECSGNIIKNVKGAVVPNSGGMKGVEAAIAIGAVGGNAQKELEVVADIQPEQIAEAAALVKTRAFCEVKVLKSKAPLHVRITAFAGEHRAVVEIRDAHTNIVLLQKDEEILFCEQPKQKKVVEKMSQEEMNVREILEFANTVKLEDVQEIIGRQIEYNEKIAEEGLQKEYGASVGANLLKYYGDDIKIRAKAYAAAGSDARMSGCLAPVVINSGSGNQGITVSLPVIQYAKHLQVSREKLIRALVLSNLIAIHEKMAVGRLSAYCGAVSAACGSGAAITYLHNGTYEQICATITNTLANVSGIICDGAKPSCAAKIASSVDAAILGHYLAMEQEQFNAGDGIVKEDVEQTISSVGILASQGMRETDEVILDIMVENTAKDLEEVLK